MNEIPTVPTEPEGNIQIGRNSIAPQEVRLIVGETGVSFSGGEMLIWKRNIVVASNRRYVSSKPPVFNAVDFKRWLDLCPQAVGILPNGSVQLPRLSAHDPQDPLVVLEEALTAARRELASQLLKTLGISLILTIVSVAIIILVVAYNVNHAQGPAGFRLGLLGIVLLVAACLMAVRFMMLLRRRNRIVRVLVDLVSKGEIRTDLLSQTLAPPSVEAIAHSVPGPPAVTLIPAILAILSVVLMVCPFVGLPVALISLALTFRHRGWARTLSIIGLILNVLVSAFAVTMISLGR